MIADFIGFPEARTSYTMLVEISVRLAEHAHRQREAAADAEEHLGQLSHARR